MSASSVPLQQLLLRDGRILEYGVAGPPEGLPLLSLHGLLGGASIDDEHEALCQKTGVRLITVARPGYGRSTPLDVSAETKVVTLLSDFEELLEFLGIEEYAVFAVSAGAPYALACAARLRPLHTTIVSGLPPVFSSEVRGGYGAVARAVFASFRAPGALGVASRRAYTRFFLRTVRRLLPDEPATEDAACFEGAGVLREIQLQQRLWGFDFTEARGVHWFHGDQDTEAPLPALQRAVSWLPGVTLEIVPGMTHFPSPEQWERFYRAAVAAAAQERLARQSFPS